MRDNKDNSNNLNMSSKFTNNQSKDSEIHIVFCGDDNYMKYIATTIFSIINTACSEYKANLVPSFSRVKLFEILSGKFSEANEFCKIGGGSKEYYNKQNLNNLNKQNANQAKFIFHILSDFISPINKAKLENLSQTLNIEIKTYLLDNNIFTSYIPWGEGHNFTTYYRLKIASFLPQHIEKCIYLDSDMIVNHNILELYRTDLQGKMCGVVGDERISDQTMVVLDENNNYKINTKYSFNAGLLLLNLKKWREQNIESKLFNLLKNVRLTDQDALNVVFDDDILLLDSRWNCFPALIENSPKKAWHHIFSDEANDEIKATTKSTKEQYANICKEAKIIHFGGPKPWQIKMYTFPNSYIFQTNHYYFRLWWVNSVHSNFYSDIRNSFLKSFLKTIYVKIKKPEQIFRTHIIKPIKNLRKKG